MQVGLGETSHDILQCQALSRFVSMPQSKSWGLWETGTGDIGDSGRGCVIPSSSVQSFSSPSIGCHVCDEDDDTRTYM